MKREQIHVQPIDIFGNPAGPSAELDGFAQFSLVTEGRVREEFGFGEQRTRADGQFTVTFQIPFVPGSSWFPYADPRWWFVAATWRAQNEQLAIESRAGQYRRLWDEYQRRWRGFWRDAIESGALVREEPLTLNLWLPPDPERDPSKWTIEIGDEVHSLMRDIGLQE